MPSQDSYTDLTNTCQVSGRVALLEAGGYVGVDKGRIGRRTRTWLDLAPEGQSAYRRHIAALVHGALNSATTLHSGQTPARRSGVSATRGVRPASIRAGRSVMRRLG